jgi:MinD superfamily P-loop ATPase
MPKPIELTIISGKGGTGKTVLASSLAVLFENRVMADCDVDAADLHLLLDPKVRRREAFSASQVAVIDSEVCIGCGRCLEGCRFDAVKVESRRVPEVYQIDGLSCEGCGVCAWVCPVNAIHMEDTASGEWFISETRLGPLVHAQLAPAQENSGKLVSIVRSQARKLAIERGYRLVLIDGPPGIGCPVIASIAGADLAVIVTEPTLSGIHDLERVVGLANHFDLRAGVVINKHDLNGEVCLDIEKFLAGNGTPLLGKIRFDAEVSKAIAAGKPLLEVSQGEVAGQIRMIADRIHDLIQLNPNGIQASK